MADKNRTNLKQYFQRGDRPTEQQFSDLIDSFLNKIDDEITVKALTKFIGVGIANPSAKVDVNGKVKAQGFIMPTNAAEGKVITSDAAGNFSWQGTNIGDEIEGGIVFHVDGLGRHGLVCSTYDQINAHTWHNSNQSPPDRSIQSFGNAVGAGNLNTFRITQLQGTGAYAALSCNNLTLGNYSDWYLPSIYELSLMYKNLKSKNLGNFDDVEYWSSTEHDISFSMVVDFSNGALGTLGKDNLRNVRAIRAF